MANRPTRRFRLARRLASGLVIAGLASEVLAETPDAAVDPAQRDRSDRRFRRWRRIRRNAVSRSRPQRQRDAQARGVLARRRPFHRRERHAAPARLPVAGKCRRAHRARYAARRFVSLRREPPAHRDQRFGRGARSGSQRPQRADRGRAACIGVERTSAQLRSLRHARHGFEQRPFALMRSCARSVNGACSTTRGFRA